MREHGKFEKKIWQHKQQDEHKKEKETQCDGKSWTKLIGVAVANETSGFDGRRKSAAPRNAQHALNDSGNAQHAPNGATQNGNGNANKNFAGVKVVHLSVRKQRCATGGVGRGVVNAPHETRLCAPKCHVKQPPVV